MQCTAQDNACAGGAQVLASLVHNTAVVPTNNIPSSGVSSASNPTPEPHATFADLTASGLYDNMVRHIFTSQIAPEFNLRALFQEVLGRLQIVETTLYQIRDKPSVSDLFAVAPPTLGTHSEALRENWTQVFQGCPVLPLAFPIEGSLSDVTDGLARLRASYNLACVNIWNLMRRQCPLPCTTWSPLSDADTLKLPADVYDAVYTNLTCGVDAQSAAGDDGGDDSEEQSDRDETQPHFDSFFWSRNADLNTMAVIDVDTVFFTCPLLMPYAEVVYGNVLRMGLNDACGLAFVPMLLRRDDHGAFGENSDKAVTSPDLCVLAYSHADLLSRIAREVPHVSFGAHMAGVTLELQKSLVQPQSSHTCYVEAVKARQKIFPADTLEHKDPSNQTYVYWKLTSELVHLYVHVHQRVQAPATWTRDARACGLVGPPVPTHSFRRCAEVAHVYDYARFRRVAEQLIPTSWMIDPMNPMRDTSAS